VTTATLETEDDEQDAQYDGLTERQKQLTDEVAIVVADAVDDGMDVEKAISATMVYSELAVGAIELMDNSSDEIVSDIADGTEVVESIDRTFIDSDDA